MGHRLHRYHRQDVQAVSAFTSFIFMEPWALWPDSAGMKEGGVLPQYSVVTGC